MPENKNHITESEDGTFDKQKQHAVTQLQRVLRGNCQTGKGGTYAVCSAHPAVIDAAIQKALADGSILHVESTSSQVNQFGGYTGSTPAQFAQWIRSSAQKTGVPANRILLGGDHLGPFPWRNEKSSDALEKARTLVRDCVTAGYQKIHLDASMACADDDLKAGVSERTIAARAAVLCQAAEETHRDLPPGSPQLVYVVGTEVPAPGGESHDAGEVALTKPADVDRTLEIFRTAFEELGLNSAWQRVIALVVQPGVDFGSSSVLGYDRRKAASLSVALSAHPGIVYEAHSTDYQSPEALRSMVEDHFAILKVGPWLTFAYREAVLALSAIERELFRKTTAHHFSHVRRAVEAAMLQDPTQWRSYYHGHEDEVRRDLIYAYSDRCRYYWNHPSVQEEVARLLRNLATKAIPPTLISQYLPLEYEAVRAGELPASPEHLIQHHIRRVLRVYASACSQNRSIEP